MSTEYEFPSAKAFTCAALGSYTPRCWSCWRLTSLQVWLIYPLFHITNHASWTWHVPRGMEETLSATLCLFFFFPEKACMPQGSRWLENSSGRENHYSLLAALSSLEILYSKFVLNALHVSDSMPRAFSMPGALSLVTHEFFPIYREENWGAINLLQILAR